MKLRVLRQYINSYCIILVINVLYFIFSILKITMPFLSKIFKSGYDSNRYSNQRQDQQVTLSTLTYKPLVNTAKKIAKIFADYYKPYKSMTQISDNFKQPIYGIIALGIGLAKLAVGIATLNLFLSADGLLHVLKGMIEILTTPLTWLLKPIIRGLITWYNGGFKLIEYNTRLQQMANEGLDFIASSTPKKLVLATKEHERSIEQLNTLHYKFVKAYNKGQLSLIKAKEQEIYTALTTAAADNESKNYYSQASDYFSLFAPSELTPGFVDLEEETIEVHLSY